MGRMSDLSIDFREYVRILELQAKCFARGKRKWAKALGLRLKEMHAINPILRDL